MRAVIVTALIAILASLALPVHAQSRSDWPADCKLSALAELPMALASGHAAIPASADGKTLMLGIDTGGYGSALSKEGIARLGLLYSSRLGAIVPAAGGSFVSEGNVHLDSLRIGALQLTGLNLPEMPAFPGVDGLIGPDILARYDAEFDFGARIFRLFEPHPCAARAVTWTSRYTVIPFTPTRSGHVRVRVTLDSQTMDAILDTGAPISVMSMEDANRLFGLGPASAGVAAANEVAGTAWAGAVPAYAARFESLAMGGVTISAPRMELIEGRNFLGNDYATLVLGNDVLARFHLYIAYRQQKLYLSDAAAR